MLSSALSVLMLSQVIMLAACDSSDHGFLDRGFSLITDAQLAGGLRLPP